MPVVGFWSSERSLTRPALAEVVAGTGERGRLVYGERDDLAALAAALGVVPGPNVRNVRVEDISGRLEQNPRALGIVRAAAVTPQLRALAVDGRSLFGVSRVLALGDWPLLVGADERAVPSAFDPGSLWTLAAGGDVMLDRAVYRLAVLGRRGHDFPWDGGTARITARVCCGWRSERVVRGERTGNTGAFRALLSGADVALVNLEGPAPDAFAYHPSGYIFTMDPGLLGGLLDAGIDAVSLGNNHVMNAGTTGLRDTARNLDHLGIAHAGAGRNASEAGAAAWLPGAPVRVALLAYNAVASGRNATESTAGAAALRLPAVRRDIRAARDNGAALVIVMPHWGREYTDAVGADQRRTARELVEAGADLVLGSHSHWPGPLEWIRGRPVVYSLGDLVFDLTHDERTQEGVVAELTFAGPRLVQVDLRPTLILEGSQPNLLEPDGGGNLVLERVRRASDRLVRATAGGQ